MTVTAAQRASLASSGEHIFACLLLGDDYTNDEYIEAITAARQAGIGAAYATKMLGTDVDALVRGVEQDSDEAIIRAAESSLRRRGVDPKKASYREFADALVQAAS
jgi:hypothetical protein